MKRRNPPKDVGEAIKSGYRPMFMTGPEIMQHAIPNDVDVNEGETPSDTWTRKLKEAKMTGEERYGKYAFEPGRSINGPTLRRLGIEPKESIESISQKKGGPQGFVSLEDRGHTQYLVGGHHRVALSNEQFKTHLFPVKYFKDLKQAKQEPGYQ